MGQALGGVPVDLDIRDALRQAGGQALLQGPEAGHPVGHLQARHLRGHPQAHDADEVFGAGPALVFLEAAVYQGPDRGPLLEVEGPHPRRAVKLVGRQAQQVHPQLLDVHRHDPHGRHRVGVHHHLVLLGDPGDVGDGFDGADLVVGQHDADEDGVGGDGLLHRPGVHQPVMIHVQGGNPVVQEAQGPERIQHRFVFDVGGDDVAALLPKADGRPLDGVVDGLGAAGVEDHFLGVRGIDEGGHLLPGLFQGLGRRMPHLVVAGRVAEDSLHIVDHRLFHFGV